MFKRKLTKKRIIIFFVVIIILFIIGSTIFQNKTVGNTYYSLQYANLPASFNGYKIAQISDLHNAELGEDNSKIIASLRNNPVDIIAITGDLLDSKHTDYDIALNFIRQAVEIAPCFYVTGNHEAWLGDDFLHFAEELKKVGVHVLRNERVELRKGNATISLIGVDDPDFYERNEQLEAAVMQTNLENIKDINKNFTILLSHRPELFNVYVENNIDLILSGHTHGGQIRLPFIGALLAPNQGFLPKYDAGLYEEQNTKMIVSRGLGNSVIPFRINNKPELVYIELVKE